MSKYRSTFLLFLALILPLVVLSVQAQGDSSGQGTKLSNSYLSKNQQSSKVSGDLIALQVEYAAFRQTNSQEVFQSSNPLLRGTAGHVVIDATAAGDADTLLVELEALGLENGATFERIVSGLLPIVSINDLDRLESLNFARPAYAATHVGLVDSQGDAAMRSDDARLTFGVDGTGITVGTLSDSYNCIGGAAGDVASGDLPPGIVVLEEEAGCISGSDEGRAMMQLIADVAPGADQAFHTAVNGMADFATGIVELATVAGSDVIVDDVIYFAEPMFQDGIVAQAVDTVEGLGVPYFSSAGNNGRQSYQSAYVPSGISPLGGNNNHDFDPGAGVDVFQNVTIPVGATVRIVFQWDQPFFSVSGAPGSANDLDIVLFNHPPTAALALGVNTNVGGDPLEIIGFTNPGPATSFNILIDKFSGAGPGLMKYIYFGPMTINEYGTASSTVFGHANAAGAEAVGAAFYGDTPEFGTNPTLLEPFSSAGPTPILFTVAGTPTNELRQKPEIVAPDGTNNTFFGVDVEPDGFPNFFGTSAAAPHAAAVAALMIEASGGALSPADVYDTLETTAADMLTPGFDDDSGYGLVQAALAVGAVVSPEADLEISKVDDIDPVVAGNQLTYTVNVLNNGPDAAASVALTDTLPSGVSFVSATPSSPTCSEAGGTVTCSLGTVASGSNTDVIIVVDVNPGTSGIITNLATVSTTTTDTDSSNDDTSEDTNVTVPGKDDTTTKLTSSQNPSVHGQTVTFTATVTPVTTSDPATGSVTFKEGTTVLGTDTLDGAGKATFSTSVLTIGSHPITAVYSGDSNYNASSGILVPDQVVIGQFKIALPLVLKE
jgi:uncharacterized repeat protein (TIGR01451 family)